MVTKQQITKPQINKRQLLTVCLTAMVLSTLSWPVAMTFGDDSSDATFALNPSTTTEVELDSQEQDDRDLSKLQSRLASRYELLEKKLLDLHEYEKEQNPDRSRLLSEAYRKSKDSQLVKDLQEVALELERERLKDALQGQDDALEKLANLLELLQSEDRNKRILDQKKLIEQRLKEINRIMLLQRGIRGQTEEGGDTERLSKSQERAAERAGKLNRELQSEQEQKEADDKQSDDPESDDAQSDEETDQQEPADDADESPQEKKKASGDKSDADGQQEDGDPERQDKTDKTGEKKEGAAKSEDQPADSQSPEPGKPTDQQPTESQQGQPGSQQQQQQQQQQQPPKTSPEERVQQHIEEAEKRMKDAQRKLDDAQREESVEEMEKAEAELAQAKKELEELLRQLREEEVERTLTQLMARFRRMLEQEQRLYEDTKRLARIVPEQRGNEFDVRSNKLGIEQQGIAIDADRALILLREEGSSIAFPATVEQMRDDMEQIAAYLSESKVETFTQLLQEEVIETLEYLIEALDQEQKKREQEENDQPPQPPSQQQQGEPPLVNQINELKMLRGLQDRVNRRHKRYSLLLDNPDDLIGATDDPELQRLLIELSVKQRDIQQITREIVLSSDR